MKWSYHQNEVYPLIFVTAPHSNKEDKISFFNTLISSYRIQVTKLIDVKFNRSLIQTKKGSYPIHKSPTFAGSGRGDWLATLTTTTNQPPRSTNLNPQPAIFFFFFLGYKAPDNCTKARLLLIQTTIPLNTNWRSQAYKHIIHRRDPNFLTKNHLSIWKYQNKIESTQNPKNNNNYINWEQKCIHNLNSQFSLVIMTDHSNGKKTCFVFV